MGALRWVLLAALATVVGCSNAWEYREREDGTEFAVLKNPEEVLPSYGKDWSLILEADVKRIEASGKVGLESKFHKFYEDPDQTNFQLRNCIVALYASYINTEYDANVARREEARRAWREALLNLQERAFRFREAAVKTYNETLFRTQEAVRDQIQRLVGLEMPDDARAKFREDVATLAAIEGTLDLPDPSGITTLAKGIRAYQDGRYRDVRNLLTGLNSPLAEQHYVLGAALVRDKEYRLANDEFSRLEKLAPLLPLSEEHRNRLQAMALVGQGVVLRHDRSENEAIAKYAEAEHVDKKNIVAPFNRAEALFTLNKFEREGNQDGGIAALKRFIEVSELDAARTVKLLVDDKDFSKAAGEHLESWAKPQKWEDKLLERLQSKE